MTILTDIRGSNLSGRSKVLRKLGEGQDGKARYLLPISSLNLSGLASTVAGELSVWNAAFPGTKARALELLQNVGACRTMVGDQPLESLSGGEVSSFALAIYAATLPDYLAIDGSLDQIDNDRRQKFLKALATIGEAHKRVAFTSPDDAIKVEGSDILYLERSDESREFERSASTLAEKLGTINVGCKPIRFSNLSFAYSKSRPIFSSAELSLQPGKVYRLKAPNGGGKSTFARLLSGSLKARNFRVSYGDKYIDPYRTNHPLISVALQDPLAQIYGETLGRHFDALRGQDTFGVIDDMISGFDLSSYLDSEPLDLPLPILKRVGIASAISTSKGWVFLDEPSFSADAWAINAFGKIMKAWSKSGGGVIFVSHGNVMDGLSDRSVSIQAGRILEDAKLEQ